MLIVDLLVAVITIGLQITGVGYFGWYIKQNGFHLLKKPLVYLPLLPGLFTILLISLLMSTMYKELGGWPDYIGTQGFSEGLASLAETTTGIFYLLLIVSVFIAPAIFLICTLVPRWRFAAFLTSIFIIGHVAVWCFLLFLPGGFKYWWWD